jgi:hypothetical protein
MIALLTSFLGPVGSVLSWVLSPIGKYVSIALVILAVVGAIYAKGRLDQNSSDKTHFNQEAAHAVQKAGAASSAAQGKFDKGDFNSKPSRLVPRWVHHGSDGFSRD